MNNYGTETTAKPLNGRRQELIANCLRVLYRGTSFSTDSGSCIVTCAASSAT